MSSQSSTLSCIGKMVIFNSSSLIHNTGNLLRRKRKHLIPYKGKWQQTFNEQQAMEALKKAAAAASSTKTPETQNPTTNKPPLLSTLIDSFSIYACDPTPSAYIFVIKTLTQNSQFDQLPPVLDRIQKLDPPEEIFSYLIRSYGYVNRIDDAVELFFRIPSFRCTPSALSLNALLSVLCKRKETLPMVHQVLSQATNIRLEESSFRILVSSLCKIKRIGYAIEMLNLMCEYGYEPDSALYSCILLAMCKVEGISSVEVLRFFEEMRERGFCPDGVDYANVVRFLVKDGKVMDALRLINQMKVGGIKPDVVVYTSVLSGVVMVGDFAKAEELFDEMLVLGVLPDIRTYNVYLKGLCKQNKIEPGFKLVGCMEELGCKPDVSTYNMLMRALCKVGSVRRAREEVVKMMRQKGIQGNLHTYSILIDGLMCEGEVVEAMKLFEDMLNRGLVPLSLACDEMICRLCKRGLISEALQILKQMVEKSISPGASAWGALLSIPELSVEETTSLDMVLGGK